ILNAILTTLQSRAALLRPSRRNSTPRTYRCSLQCPLFVLILPRPPASTLFPYTTLFRSPGSRPASVTVSDDRITQTYDCAGGGRSEEHTSELQSLTNLVCRLLLEKKKTSTKHNTHRIPAPTPPVAASAPITPRGSAFYQI